MVSMLRLAFAFARSLIALQVMLLSLNAAFGAQAVDEQTAKPTTVVASERIGLSVVVYNQGIALVRDMRRALIPPGEVVIEFPDVSPSMDFDSVEVSSTNAPEAIQVAMHKLLANRPTPSALLEKSIGRAVTIIRYAEDGSTAEKIEGQLLAVDGARPATIKVGDKLLLYPPGMIVLSEMPEDMVLKPRLLVFAKSKEARTHNLVLTYIASNLNWSTDYIAIISEEDNRMDLTGYANVQNDAGISFPYAKLQLIAGALRVIREREARREVQFAARAAPAPGEVAVTEEPFFEYHLYDIPQKVTLDEKGSLRIGLVSAKGARVEKQFVITAPGIMFEPRAREERLPAQIVISFVNDEKHGLGMPLPAGKVKLHKLSSDGKPIFIGEAPVAHIGKGQKVEWGIGSAFDIVGSWRQVKFAAPTAREREMSVEVVITNGKDKEVVVQLRQPIGYGLEWEIIQSSHEWKQRDAMTAEFTVPVPPSAKTTLTFTAKVRLRP
ncbi:MAG: hypothetical protein RMK18_09145 [Armatimonadota bacterium]|nr:hypothetical protein [Armatimonadota bacterium]MCX7778019.1 hypothetical protein [Armatimonadota bacterium]MDW8026008.1 hypothetical protein [Armatimonadota bacterium]